MPLRMTPDNPNREETAPPAPRCADKPAIMTKHADEKRTTVTIRLKPSIIAAIDAQADTLAPRPSRAALIESILESHVRASEPAQKVQRKQNNKRS